MKIETMTIPDSEAATLAIGLVDNSDHLFTAQRDIPTFLRTIGFINGEPDSRSIWVATLRSQDDASVDLYLSANTDQWTVELSFSASSNKTKTLYENGQLDKAMSYFCDHAGMIRSPFDSMKYTRMWDEKPQTVEKAPVERPKNFGTWS